MSNHKTKPKVGPFQLGARRGALAMADNRIDFEPWKDMTYTALQTPQERAAYHRGWCVGQVNYVREQLLGEVMESLRIEQLISLRNRLLELVSEFEQVTE